MSQTPTPGGATVLAECSSTQSVPLSRSLREVEPSLLGSSPEKEAGEDAVVPVRGALDVTCDSSPIDEVVCGVQTAPVDSSLSVKPGGPLLTKIRR